MADNLSISAARERLIESVVYPRDVGNIQVLLSYSANVVCGSREVSLVVVYRHCSSCNVLYFIIYLSITVICCNK